MKTRRSHEERRTATREALLEAAVEVIAEVGYRDGTTTLIAKRAAVTRGALQYHFPAREDLVLAVIDRVMTRINFELDVGALQGEPLEMRVRELVRSYRAAFDSPYFTAAVQIFVGVRSDPVLSRRSMQLLEETQGRMNESWRALFPEIADPEQVMPALRRLTMSAARGASLLENFGLPSTWDHDGALLEAMVLRELRAIAGVQPTSTR